MRKNYQSILYLFLWVIISVPAWSQNQIIDIRKLSYKIYPEVNDYRPDLPSPFTDPDKNEFVVAATKENKYAIIPVTLSNDRGICRQLIVNKTDFPHLAKTGLHSDEELNQIATITGRSLEEITRLGRPNALSHSGFMAADEEIISVIRGDNDLVRQLGLTHPQLAKPLFHVLNMMDHDLDLNRWNMATHRWENITYFYYNNKKVFVDAGDTKGGQKSIFDDGIQGAFHIKLWRNFDEDEIRLLDQKYAHLTTTQFDTLKILLSHINTGEIEPQYIMRYGFYEGHTYWRAEPIAIAFIFGMKDLKEIDDSLNSRLHRQLNAHFSE